MKRVIGILSFAWLLVVGEIRAEVPTFNKEIAPILWKNCAGCHRPGEIGPFSLLTYRDAAKRASFLGRLAPGERARLIAEGFPIPERFRAALGRFDRNKDGKLSREEIDGMPEAVRGRVQEAIRRRVGGDAEKPE
jgi:hypothetical protein